MKHLTAAWTRQVIAGRKPYWHLTNNPRFKPSADHRPPTRGGRDVATTPMLFVTQNPLYWTSVAGGSMGAAWASNRKWAAEIEALPGHPPLPEYESAIGYETVVDPRYVRVVRIIPVDEAIAEQTGYDKDGNSTKTWPYRYSGPDFP